MSSYNPEQQYAQWKQECDEIKAYDFERVERQLQDGSYAVERDEQTPLAEPTMEVHGNYETVQAEIIKFQDFLERKRHG